jgi:putative transcriptional regulator
MEDKQFARLVESIKQMNLIRAGQKNPARVHCIKPVEEIRSKLHLSQREFAGLLGISDATLKNWEQGRVKPDGSARILLQVVAKNPKAVFEASHA